MKVHKTLETRTSRRVFATGAVSLVAALALSACGGAAPTGSGTAAAKPDLKASGAGTITMWVDAERSPALKDITEKFKAETGVEVKLVVKDFAAVRDDFITQVPTGKGPDLIVGPHDWIGKFVQNGVIAPIEIGDKKSAFQDSSVNAMTFNGSMYGVPYSIENIALLRNTDIVPAEAATFDEVIANGKQAVAEGKAAFPFLVGLDPKQADPYHVYPLQASMGSQVFGKAADGGYDAKQLLIGDAAGVEFAKKLATWGDAGEKILNSNITGDIAKEKFLAGESPYFLTGPWNVPDVQKKGIKFAVDALPTTGDSPAQPFIGVNGFFISAKSANALATSEFVTNYLTSEAAQDSMYTAGGRPPALKASFDKAASDPVVAAFGKIGATGVPMPAIPEMSAVWADWGATELSIIKGEVDPAEAWTKMAASIKTKIGG
ncbi:maltose ABC transporter substrate-binding protein [Pseudarthrobacter sp. J75]|uniref:sugar ABC transporter substrate-binding protein n=1 Tax=unclassified Pseudarthrobacter TaxID=2647000 RepID=UPI002E816947|nr:MULTISPECIES: maltose ABC transporter substrate-binding protein [unclassified Pseudarthrobacter]MEE2522367.1 maltose ABC transporter substrate-binding protein [Pseudarthrobacter sp. J47]MEE2527987.1 maltose ABC transporter substrate-binding protein [Pseudarthrobacter sp. J75]MEE2568772.1 maltose ABC transporter substrate-binding protein [Pseudarthrobacter sp. J64]